jgi:hypothetical protein
MFFTIDLSPDSLNEVATKPLPNACLPQAGFTLPIFCFNVYVIYWSYAKIRLAKMTSLILLKNFIENKYFFIKRCHL